MFLNYLKNIFLKYRLRNKWQEVKVLTNANSIQTIGVLVDETKFTATDSLVRELMAMGREHITISVICYKDKLNQKETYLRTTFDLDVVNWQGDIKEGVVHDFIQTEFDLLVSFYDMEKAILLLITNDSKAKFKVGFASTDKRFHHLMIQTAIENYSVFVEELLKYLKILNKIKS